MKSIVNFLFFILFIDFAYAQAPNWAWAKKAGRAKGERANTVTTDGSGNTYVCGEFQNRRVQDSYGFTLSNSGYGSDIFIQKYNDISGPVWGRAFGGTDHDVPTDICADNIGNVYMAGYFYGQQSNFDSFALVNTSPANSDFFIVKTDLFGNVLWALRAGGSENDQAQSMGVDASGNLYVCGFFESDSIVLGTDTLINTSQGTSNIFISKLDPNGNFIWNLHLGSTDDDEITSLFTLTNGEIYAAGNFKSNSITLGSSILLNSGGSDLFLCKLDSSGNFIWALSAGGIGDESAKSVSADGQGNVYWAGEFFSDSIHIGGSSLFNTSSGSSDAFISRFDSAGSLQWNKSIAGINSETAAGIYSDVGGTITVTGNFNSPSISFDSLSLTNASGSPDIFWVQYDLAGNVQWTNKVNGSLEDISTDITISPGGDIYSTGFFKSPQFNLGPFTIPNFGNATAFLARFTNNGICLVADPIIYPYQIDDRTSDIATDSNGNTFVTGWFNSSSLHFDSFEVRNSGTGYDLFIVKYNSAGAFEWAQGAVGKSWEYGHSLCLDPFDNLYAAGFAYDTITIGQITLPGQGQTRFFITKIDNNGNILWAKEYGSRTNATDICSDLYGNIYIAGGFSGDSVVFGSFTLTNSSPASSDIFILKLDSGGNVLWAQKAEGNYFDYVSGIAVDQYKNVFITGTFLSDSLKFGSSTLYNYGFLDLYISKLDSNGNFLWADGAGGQYGDVSNAISTDPDGNAYITGYFLSASLVFGSEILTNPTVNTKEIFIVKYLPGGNISWAERIGGTGSEEAIDIAIDATGNIYQTGYFRSATVFFGSYILHRFGSQEDIFISRIDSAGNILFAQREGGTSSDIPTAISLNQNGILNITGSFGVPYLSLGIDTLSGLSGYNIFVARLDSMLYTNTSERIDNEQVTVFPNPFSSNISMITSLVLDDASIILFNVLGETIAQINNISGHTVEIPCDQLKRGMYFFKLVQDDKIISTKKIIKVD